MEYHNHFCRNSYFYFLRGIVKERFSMHVDLAVLLYETFEWYYDRVTKQQNIWRENFNSLKQEQFERKKIYTYIYNITTKKERERQRIISFCSFLTFSHA